MIAIIMRRQAGSKRIPEWEEAAATACAVQNMHIQATKFPGLACYWSSWHDAYRDSEEHKRFLGMGGEDRSVSLCASLSLSLSLSHTHTHHLLPITHYLSMTHKGASATLSLRQANRVSRTNVRARQRRTCA